MTSRGKREVVNRLDGVVVGDLELYWPIWELSVNGIPCVIE